MCTDLLVIIPCGCPWVLHSQNLPVILSSYPALSYPPSLHWRRENHRDPEYRGREEGERMMVDQLEEEIHTTGDCCCRPSRVVPGVVFQPCYESLAMWQHGERKHYCLLAACWGNCFSFYFTWRTKNCNDTCRCFSSPLQQKVHKNTAMKKKQKRFIIRSQILPYGFTVLVLKSDWRCWFRKISLHRDKRWH